MITLTLKEFVKYMLGSPSQQRKVLRDNKFPDPDGRVQILYYLESRNFIESFHRNCHEVSWLIECARRLKAESSQLLTGSKNRYINNSRVLLHYAQYFGAKKFQFLPSLSTTYFVGNVGIKATPDLHVMEGKRERLIKLEFNKEAPDERKFKIMSQLMYESFIQESGSFGSSDVLIYDIPRGNVYKGARVGSRLNKEIEAACENISAIYDTI